MFMCKHCLEQFDDSQLAYTLIQESRLSHPAADTFVLKFCSRAHVQEFLGHISNQRQRYVLTKVESDGATKQFGPDYPLELLLLVGSSKAS
jgi:hypothetical protein